MGRDPDAGLDELLAFWFSEEAEPFWFKKSTAFDARLRQRFAHLIFPAAQGELGHRAAAPVGAVGLCLVLDQLPRNLFRGSARAFAYDPTARSIARAAVAAGHDRELDAKQRLFLYLPLQHGEDPADQQESVRLFDALGDPELTDYARRHQVIIERFGRFPHRNAALGRPSTPEELAFLCEPGSSF